MRYRLFLILLTALTAVSCQHKALNEDDPCGDKKVKVVINWDDHSTQARPMRINLFSRSAGIPDYGREEVPISGVKYVELFSSASYQPFCYDYEAPNIYFRNELDLTTFEAYFSGVSRTTYEKYASPVPNEVTYSSPSGGEFYVDAWTNTFDVNNTPMAEQLLNFYPKNILRQFTFRINNIKGEDNIQDMRGAASGMAAVFIFHTNSPTNVRSTLIFGNITKAYDAVNEYGYLEGEFYSFGAMSPYQNRFTIEIYSNAGKYFGAYWDVSTQIDESMTDREAKLARDGYDILIWNNRDTDIPEIDPSQGSESGFEIGVSDWGEEQHVYL